MKTLPKLFVVAILCIGLNPNGPLGQAGGGNGLSSQVAGHRAGGTGAVRRPQPK